jgi:alkanesulfonate monooxygenase SsuD/methylene tetrahydromethanopterin reductase-like flavin-dependent oxidoreductase (luciferase family)
MRLSTVILPIHRWSEGREVWQRAEELGFHAAYTYDHLSWRSFRDEAWFGAVPTLTAAATVTQSIRLGTLVTSPNFRHPVTLAKELLTVDDISGGRLTVGIGVGGTGFDATAMGQEPWPARQRRTGSTSSCRCWTSC